VSDGFILHGELFGTSTARAEYNKDAVYISYFSDVAFLIHRR